jgi:hypothetical protein
LVGVVCHCKATLDSPLDIERYLYLVCNKVQKYKSTKSTISIEKITKRLKVPKVPFL